MKLFFSLPVIIGIAVLTMTLPQAASAQEKTDTGQKNLENTATPSRNPGTNPLLGGGSSQKNNTVEQERSQKSLWGNMLLRVVRSPRWFVTMSKKMESSISSAIQKMYETKNITYAFIALLIALLFGAIHIIGPGHGKVFTILYFSSRNSRLREGVFFSILINIIDSLSAILIVSLTYFILNVALNKAISKTQQILALVSYGIIIIFGIGHMISHIAHNHKTHTKKELKPWVLAIAVGLVPCPVSTFIFVYGIVHSMIPFALLLIAATSLGGFITMLLLSFLIIGGKTTFNSIVHGHGKSAAILSTVEWMTSILIIGIGIIFFLAYL